MHLLLWWILLYRITSGNMHSKSTFFLLISAVLVICIHLLCCERTYWDNLLFQGLLTEIIYYSKDCLEFFWVFGGGISFIALTFCRSGFTPFLDIIWPKNRVFVYLKWHLSSFSVRFTCLHTCRTLLQCVIMILTISIITYNQNNISVAIKIRQIYKYFKYFVFLWNISPVWAVLNGNLLYLYLPNWHVNAVRYDDLSSSLKVWYPELGSMTERYCTSFNAGNTLLSIGPLCAGLINGLI